MEARLRALDDDFVRGQVDAPGERRRGHQHLSCHTFYFLAALPTSFEVRFRMSLAFNNTLVNELPEPAHSQS